MSTVTHPARPVRPHPARRRILALVLAGSLALGAVACSSDGSDGASPSTTAAPSDDGAATTTTVAGDDGTETSGAAASAGCQGEPLAPGRETVTVTSGGDERTYSRYVPEGLEAGQPAPLVVDFPAYSPASLEEDFSGFTKPGADGTVKADEVGAIVVTPEPTNGAGTLLTWNYVGTPGWTDDQAFVTDLLDDVEATACVDPDRVLATGFAVGATFASITACGQTDRFAVLATVSGLYSPEGCEPSKPLPVISFHGTGDRFIPFDGSIGSGPSGLGLTPETTEGLVFMVEREGALPSSEAWAAHDGCDPEPTESPVVDGVVLQTWTGCEGGSTVELYVIDGGEHTWPGSVGMAGVTSLLGPVSTKIDATDLIWTFFEAHTT